MIVCDHHASSKYQHNWHITFGLQVNFWSASELLVCKCILSPNRVIPTNKTTDKQTVDRQMNHCILFRPNPSGWVKLMCTNMNFLTFIWPVKHHTTNTTKHYVIMHPLWGSKGRGVADRQRRGCISISREFLVWILILHILQVTKGSTVYFSYYRLLQVTTDYLSYYKLLEVTTVYYSKVTVVIIFYMVNIGYYRLQCVYNLL